MTKGLFFPGDKTSHGGKVISASSYIDYFFFCNVLE